MISKDEQKDEYVMAQASALKDWFILNEVDATSAVEIMCVMIGAQLAGRSKKLGDALRSIRDVEIMIKYYYIMAETEYRNANKK